MVWQNNVRVIVMLTRIVECFGFNSCSQYWPSGPVGRKKKVGGNLEIQLYDDQVQFISSQFKFYFLSRNSPNKCLSIFKETEHYTVRKLDLTWTTTGSNGGGSLEGSFGSNSGGSGTREIVQIQYTSWPDRSAPSDASALLQLIEVRVEIGQDGCKNVQTDPV